MKPGTDYSKSAIALKNPPEVLELLKTWAVLRDHHQKCIALASQTPEAKREAGAFVEVVLAHNELKEAIDQAGSYQDIDFGLYAIKQQRVSVSYDPAKVRTAMPDYAAIIEEHVPVDKIKGLLKGKLITEAQAAECEVKITGSPAYVIDVLPPVEQVIATPEVPNAD